MSMSTASIDWVSAATAVSAVASAVAAIAALVVTVLVAKLQNRWEERRKERENRKVIQTFIEDLSDACGGVWARVVFRNLDRPEDDLAGRIADTGNIQTEYLDVFKRAQDELARFDDASMPAMSNMLRGVREFRSWCTDCQTKIQDTIRWNDELAQEIVQSDRPSRRLRELRFAYERGIHSSCPTLMRFGSRPIESLLMA
jgi:hypothetical protein